MRTRAGPKPGWAQRAGVAMTMAVALVAGLLPTSPVPSAAAEDEPEVPDGLLPPGDWESWQEERMLDLIADTEANLPASIDASTLSDMGFIDISIATPGGIEHWYNIPRFFDEHLLNPEYPESLVTRRTAAGRELVAVMYHLDFGETMDDIPEEHRWLPGWHPHVEACVDAVGQVVALTIPGTNSCPPGSKPAQGPPMMHVWIVDNECGHRFSGVGLGGVHCDDHGHSGDGDPGGSGDGYPSGGQGEAEADGSITVDSVPTGFGPGGPISFPSGSEGVCNPDGTPTTLTASFGDDHDGHVPVTEVEATGQPADVIVTDSGAICGEVTLEATGGGIQAGDGGTGTFRLSGVTAEVEVTGTGAFEPHLPAGCSLSLDIGELTGPIDSDGPPNAASLAASNVSVAEAPDSCGGYSQLLDVGFALPSTNAEIELDLSIGWDGSGPGGPPRPEPTDEIEVTPITTPDGRGALGSQPMINERGDIAFTPEDTTDAVLLEDGQLTRINPEGTSAEPSAITDEGQVVGSTGPSTWEASPFSWEHGEWEILPIGEAYAGRASDANDHGLVAGSLLSDVFDNGEPVVWDDGEIVKPPEELTLIPMVPVSTPAINNRNQYAFNVLTDDPGGATIWDVDGGEVVDLGTLGGGFSMVTAINDRGMATGVSTNANDELRAFLWHDGEMTDLGTLGGKLSLGISLNERGQVIGLSEDADGRFHGFLWHDGEMTRIEGLGGTGDPATGVELGMTSYPLSLNNRGQVVGTSGTPEGGSQAFLWQNGRTVNLGELADRELESRAVDINDRGEIPGYTKPSSGAGDGYLWTVSPLWGLEAAPE